MTNRSPAYVGVSDDASATQHRQTIQMALDAELVRPYDHHSRANGPASPRHLLVGVNATHKTLKLCIENKYGRE